MICRMPEASAGELVHPKDARGLAVRSKSALLKTKLQRELYGILHILRAPFLAVFWWLEKRLARLQDHLESEGA
jgi:hypothetical protein